MTTNDTHMDTALHHLALLARSGDRVRLGYTTTNGKSGRTDPMPAAEAVLYLQAMSSTLTSLGLGFSSLHVERFEV